MHHFPGSRTTTCTRAQISKLLVMAESISFLVVILSFLFAPATAAYNIANFGAKADGRTDAAKALLGAWSAACSSVMPATINVPAGRYLVSQALLQGPCKNTAIRIYIAGTLLAPSGYNSATNWLKFKYVQGVSVYGGTIDGQGQALWACKNAGRRCPIGATSLAIAESKNVLISGLTSLNSEMFHMSIFRSSGVTVQGGKIAAPRDSPNTDGIHIAMSSHVTVIGTNIGTGDDCISMGEGASNVWIERVNCGPGHGISIGSLGSSPSQAGVQNVTVTSVTFTGTQNGLRIKTWGKPNAGFVRGVRFQHAVMQNVQNPIIIDQNYCPGHVHCPGQSSGIQISQVSYNDVHGSSATQVAVKFDCSATHPCNGIGLQNVKLTYQNQQAQAYCKYVRGQTSGVVSPNCLR